MKALMHMSASLGGVANTIPEVHLLMDVPAL